MAAQKISVLYNKICGIIEAAHAGVSRSVNTAQVVSNWRIGQEIIEEEQQGKARAGYGEGLIRELAIRLHNTYGPGYGLTNLKSFKQFYLTYEHLLGPQKGHAVRGLSLIKPQADGFRKGYALRNQSPGASGIDIPGILNALREKSWKPGRLHPNLSWTHYRAFLRPGIRAADKHTFLDIQSFHGNILQLAARSESYIKEHINWRADLTGSQRVEIPEVPVRAVREAIINSLCHRDFDNPKSNEVAIYKDRIEIFNPGLFPGDYSPEDFIKGSEPSIPRNPLIAETLFRSEDIEKWGSGLKRISEECSAAGVKVCFKRIKSGFAVIFFRPGFKKSEGVTETVGGVNGGINGGVNGGVNSLEAEIRKNPGQRLPALRVALKVPGRTIENWIRKLKKAGRIIYRGSYKTGGYFPTGKRGT